MGMSCGFSECELFIIWKICRKNRWCEKHISRQDLTRGRPSDKIGEYKDAIDNLVVNGFLNAYRSQGRDDVCIPKQHRNKAIQALKAHKSEYPFIVYMEFIK
jgi:hypothetical protein